MDRKGTGGQLTHLKLRYIGDPNGATASNVEICIKVNIKFLSHIDLLNRYTGRDVFILKNFDLQLDRCEDNKIFSNH